MSQSKSLCDIWLPRLREHLKEERYSWSVAYNYPIAVKHFLRDLDQRGQTVESVSPADVESYLSTLGAERCCGPFSDGTRHWHRAAVRMLMRLVHGEWSPVVPPESVYPFAARVMVTEFDAWMKDLRGLSSSTRQHRQAEAYRLIAWLHEQARPSGV
jgi:hypothetical protein